MIPPLSFLWRQLNGPQITGITKAILSWLKSMFDPNLNYWNKFSIATANDAHLTTIISLQGFGRPVIVGRTDTNIVFETSEYNPSRNGFSDGYLHGEPDPSAPPTGGRFTDLWSLRYPVRYIDAETTRLLLTTIINSGGEIGSLVLLDDILNALKSQGTINPQLQDAYTFSWDTQGGIPGDVEVDIGSSDNWPGGLTTVALLESIFNGQYAPTPRVYLDVQT